MKKLLFLSAVLLSMNFILQGCEKKAEYFHIGVLQWTEKVEPFNKTFRGVMDGLNDKGYRQGVNLQIVFRNAEQDSDAALKFAQEFIEQDVDLIGEVRKWFNRYAWRAYDSQGSVGSNPTLSASLIFIIITLLLTNS